LLGSDFSQLPIAPKPLNNQERNKAWGKQMWRQDACHYASGEAYQCDKCAHNENKSNLADF
jgi:hypothetical protein